MTKGRSQFIGRAGQYYIAYCLSVRHIHAAITEGNVPDIDVLVASADGSKALNLQVKTATNAYRAKRYGFELREWDVGEAAVTRCSDHLWYAFVDLQEKDGCAWSPKAFVVPSLWVSTFVQPDWSRKMYLLRSELWPQCEDRWDHIRGFLDGDPASLAWSRQVPKESSANWA